MGKIYWGLHGMENENVSTDEAFNHLLQMCRLNQVDLIFV